jgi:hypothetical protein
LLGVGDAYILIWHILGMPNKARQPTGTVP